MSCRKCWGKEARAREFAENDDVFATVDICDACFDVAWDEFMTLREQFEELIKAGVPRDKANEVMIARMRGEVLS